ncbi:formamidopyrimidine-DNA glycosylase [Rickettsiales bacterium]|nr:formamidopyrimidine-DNA glycosylase [Rickettsiales bacterium]
MPELPEVETICRGLQGVLLGKKIVNVSVYADSLRKPIPRNINRLTKDASVQQISRKAKYALIFLDNSHIIIMHMGMSGRVIFLRDIHIAGKHDHLVFKFYDNSHLVYNDPRRFGLVDIISQDKLSAHPAFSRIGIEPLTKDLNSDSLWAILKKTKSPIKNALLNGKNIAGIGNIYASEILFEAAISPLRRADLLSHDELIRLVAATKKVLRFAIAAGGSTLKDYVGVDGKVGSFQDQFKVYNRKECPKCHYKVDRIAQAGRSTYYCPKCQE